MFISQRVKGLCLVPALAMLAGCAGKIRYPDFYVLNLPEPVRHAAAAAPVLGPVAVRQFDAPVFLREGAIAYRNSATRLGFYSYHRWATDPRKAVSMLMVEELRACGVFRSASLFDGHGSPDWIVTGVIDHMEEVDDGSEVSVAVALSAQLANEKTGEIAWQGSSSSVMSPGRRSVPAVVALMSQEMTVVVKELVNSAQDRLSAVARPNP
jgi:uncharacterized lipoprotein YmbA